MLPEKACLDLIRGGHGFSEKDMRNANLEPFPLRSRFASFRQGNAVVQPGKTLKHVLFGAAGGRFAHHLALDSVEVIDIVPEIA